MTEQAYLDSISSRSDDDYPAVIKISDPLLIRLSPDSLMISDTTFYAKVKYGLAFSGYVIYSSGLGTPIIEVDLTKEYSKSSSSGDNVQRNKDDVLKELVKRAAEFLDKLETRVATSESENVIKESIDRLCWQLHYDITKSKTNFVTAFEDQGFSKSVTSVDGWSDSSTVVGRTLYDYFGWNGTITNNGSDLEYGNGLIGMTEKVAWNLKHDDEIYSISKALRDAETNDTSISNATHEQTIEIDNRLGSVVSPSNGTVLYYLNSVTESVGSAASGETPIINCANVIKSSTNTIKESLGTTASTGDSTLIAWTRAINGHVSTIDENTVDIKSKTSTISSNTSDIKSDVNTLKLATGDLSSTGDGSISACLRNLNRVVYTTNNTKCVAVWNSSTQWNSGSS